MLTLGVFKGRLYLKKRLRIYLGEASHSQWKQKYDCGAVLREWIIERMDWDFHGRSLSAEAFAKVRSFCVRKLCFSTGKAYA